jgi:hypothetical protein
MSNVTPLPGCEVPAEAGCPWHAAVAAALADGARRGVILYETDAGDMPGRQPVQAERSTIRGLCLDTLDDLAPGD